MDREHCTASVCAGAEDAAKQAQGADAVADSGECGGRMERGERRARRISKEREPGESEVRGPDDCIAAAGECGRDRASGGRECEGSAPRYRDSVCRGKT